MKHQGEHGVAVVAGPITEALLVGAAVAARMCGRSEASWWRDHAAGRIPTPVKLGGRTLWRREELCRWIEARRLLRWLRCREF